MVNGTIDIHRLNMEELSGVVSMYPWYAGARMELCARMSGMGALSDSVASQTALYMGSRKILSDLVRAGRRVDCSDKDAARLASEMIAPAAEAPRRQIFVVGGDYFSQSQYSGVRKSDDNIFSRKHIVPRTTYKRIKRILFRNNYRDNIAIFKNRKKRKIKR